MFILIALLVPQGANASTVWYLSRDPLSVSNNVKRLLNSVLDYVTGPVKNVVVSFILLLIVCQVHCLKRLSLRNKSSGYERNSCVVFVQAAPR